MIVFDSDDFGANHEISDMCQSHDCRDILLELKKVNPAFKVTLFAIPGEMTPELLKWSFDNGSWIELAFHGFFHQSNYECEKMTYEEFDVYITSFEYQMNHVIKHFVKGFKAPGWQISDDALLWLADSGWWVADQASPNYDMRKPIGLKTYKVNEDPNITSIHTHTWNCVGNGVYELFDQLKEQIKDETEFRFVSEVVR